MEDTYLYNLLKKAQKKHDEWHILAVQIDKYVSQLCDFKSCVIHSEGHFKVMNLKEVHAAPISCIEGKTKDNKLSAEDHKNYKQ